MAAKCERKRIIIRKKGSRKVIAEFMGRQGSGCPPRRKPSTAHLRPWKQVMKKASPQCAKRFGGGKAFGKCMKDALRSVRG
jgi:hypothetical protein